MIGVFLGFSPKNSPHQPGIHQQIPVSKLIPLAARSDDVSLPDRREPFSFTLAQSLEPLGKVEVFQADEIFIESASNTNSSPSHKVATVRQF